MENGSELAQALGEKSSQIHVGDAFGVQVSGPKHPSPPSQIENLVFPRFRPFLACSSLSGQINISRRSVTRREAGQGPSPDTTDSPESGS